MSSRLGEVGRGGRLGVCEQGAVDDVGEASTSARSLFGLGVAAGGETSVEVARASGGSGAVVVAGEGVLVLEAVTSAVSATILAAVSTPTPTSSSRFGASWRTRAVISRSRARSRWTVSRRTSATISVAIERPARHPAEPAGDGLEVRS